MNPAGGFSYNPNPVPLCLYVFLHPLRALSVYMASGLQDLQTFGSLESQVAFARRA